MVRLDYMHAVDGWDYFRGVLGHIAEGEFLRHCGRKAEWY